MTNRREHNRAMAWQWNARKRGNETVADSITPEKARLPKVAGIRWMQCEDYMAEHVAELRKQGFTWFERGRDDAGPMPYFVRFGQS